MTEIITEADITGAERLLDLACTATERAQMVGNPDGKRDLAIARRGLSLTMLQKWQLDLMRGCLVSQCRMPQICWF